MVTLKKILNGFFKFLVANVAVVITIMMLPVFLITEDLSFFDQIMDYLFNNHNS